MPAVIILPRELEMAEGGGLFREKGMWAVNISRTYLSLSYASPTWLLLNPRSLEENIVTRTLGGEGGQSYPLSTKFIRLT